MAISAYGKALASMAKESVLGSVKGFATSVKSEAMNEMPALSGAISFARSLRKEAEKYQKETEKSNDEIKDEVKKQVKETKVGNLIGFESAKLLKSINANTVVQTRLMLQQAKFERQSRLFAEEESRERLLEQRKLLSAIRKIGAGAGGGIGGGVGGGGGDGGSIFGALGGLLGNLLGGAAVAGGGLLGYKGARALLGGRNKAPDVLGTSKTNPLLSSRKAGAVDAKMASRFLPRILGGILGGPVGWALTAYGIYELLNSIFDFNIFSSAQASTKPSVSSAVSYSPRGRSRSQNRSQGRTGKAPLSIRNNNPGNIRFANQPGATRGEAGFAKFNSPEDGIEALRRQVYLDTQTRELTLSQFIAKYAPPNENNTSRYITFVSQQTGLKPNEIVPENMIPAVMQAIVRMEGGQAAYSYFYDKSPAQVATLRTRSQGRTGNALLSSAVNYRTSISSSSITGGGTVTPQEFIVPTQDSALISLTKDQNKTLSKLGKSSETVAKIQTTRYQAERLLRTRRVETPEQRILRTANEAFLRGFQNVTTKKITDAVENALFPKGYGVTAAQTRGNLYRGQTAADLLGTSKFFNRAFGKDYGPLFNQLSQSYLEVGARAAGQVLFGGTAGVDSQALTGQILGNIKGGRKGVALEQLLYGMTGTSSGYETLFAKYGFGSAKEGVQAIGNVLGAGATDIVRRNFPFIGEVPGETMYRDPVTGKMVPYGGMTGAQFGTVKVGGVNAQAVFDMSNKPAGVSTSAAVSGYKSQGYTDDQAASLVGRDISAQVLAETKDASVVTSDATVKQNDLINEWGEEHSELEIQNTKITAKGAQDNVGATMAAAQATGNIFTRGIEWLGSIFTQGGRGGGGTTISIGGMPGGSTFGNFLIDLGKTFAVSEATKGIKNPYLKAIAGFGLNRAADVAIATAQAPGGFTIAQYGENLTKSFFGTNTSFGGGYGTTLGRQVGSEAFGMLGLAGTPFAYSTMVPGLTYGSQQAAMLAQQTGQFGAGGLSATAAAGQGATGAASASTMSKVGQAVGYTYAFYQLTQGNVAAAASTALSTYLISTGNPYAIAAAVVLSFLGIGKKKKPAAVFVTRTIPITGNSNIDAKFTIDGNNPPEGYIKLADAILNASFNATKSFEIRIQKIAPYDRIDVVVHQDYVACVLMKKDGVSVRKTWGAPHTVNMPTLVKETIEFIAKTFKDVYFAEESKINAAVESLRKKSFTQIIDGVEKSLSRELDLAPSAAGESYVAEMQAHELARNFKQPYDEMIGDGESSYATGDRMIYDMRTGKMVSQIQSGIGVTSYQEQVDQGEGQLVTVTRNRVDPNIIGIDPAGNPIYNVGSARIDAADMLEVIRNNPSLAITPIQSSASVAAPPPAFGNLNALDYRKDMMGSVNTFVNTDNSSTNVTNVSGQSASDADELRLVA